MSDFLDKHGTVILLYSLVLIAFGTTIVVGYLAKVDPEKVFTFAAGFAGGAFSGLTVAMKVTSNAAQAAPPDSSPKV